MSNEPQDIFLFFSAAFAWQVFSHFARDLMLRYYISRGYGYNQHEFHEVVLLPDAELFKIGLGELCFRRTDSFHTLSIWVDFVYIMSCLGVPVLIFGYFYGNPVPLSELDLKLFLWVAFNLLLAIPLNALRYQKHKQNLKEYHFSTPEWHENYLE